MYYLYFDGGSRGNPGIAGSGAVIYDDKMIEIYSVYYYCGDKMTNNYAEYTGLIKGIEMLVKNSIAFKDVIVRGDSQLVIKQCKGEFKVREPTLVLLHQQVKNLLGNGSFNKLEHVPRAQNKRADELSNMAMNSYKESL